MFNADPGHTSIVREFVPLGNEPLSDVDTDPVVWLKLKVPLSDFDAVADFECVLDCESVIDVELDHVGVLVSLWDIVRCDIVRERDLL